MEKFIKVKNVLLTLLFVIMLIPVNSCHKDDNDKKQETSTVSGEWQFLISPNQSYHDTDTVHGLTYSDFKEGSSSYSEIYLYEDKDQNIFGELWGYKINGKRNGNSIELIFYSYPDGPFNEDTPIKNMEAFTKMNLTIDEFGNMQGGGSYFEDPESEWTKIDSYFIDAKKLNNISNPNLKSSFKHILCEIASTFSSYLISTLTYGVFRPMASCYGHKDGGGFYAFGNEGPGSSFPIYTQTVYLAWEWSWCKVRKYDFRISLKGKSIGYEALKDEIHKMEPIFNLLKKIGFKDFDAFVNALDEFHDKYGGFALSAAYDTHTHNMSLYVNHEKGSSYDAKHDLLIEIIKAGLDGLCRNVSVYAGQEINDSWHMRRSDIGICNSDLIIFYLFGTNKVLYN
ncbi:MAG: hypothetical protein GXO86_08415 [Chlorobi bacterium]|nr:hypothetical protein [Chlorobiota bacterium]